MLRATMRRVVRRCSPSSVEEATPSPQSPESLGSFAKGVASAEQPGDQLGSNRVGGSVLQIPFGRAEQSIERLARLGHHGVEGSIAAATSGSNDPLRPTLSCEANGNPGGLVSG